jgi:phosphoglycerate dehydrogenase-like enzyme
VYPALGAPLEAGRPGDARYDHLDLGAFRATTMDNVVLTPHVAGATYETARRRASAVAGNGLRVARGDQPLHVVT